MAISLSSATSIPTSKNINPVPKTLLSIRGSYQSGQPICAKRNSTASNVLSLSSCASIGKFQSQVSRFSTKPRLVKGLRTLDIKGATTDEIEAEKSAVQKNVKEKMEKTIENIKATFNSSRTGRSNPAMLDKVKLEYYGSPVSVNSIAQITTPDAGSIIVSPYDKSSLKLIEKAIVSANLGFYPKNDGEVLRITIPPLTADRRKELIKVVAKQAEDGKVAIRSIRRMGIKAYQKLEKDKKMSEDMVKDLSADLQKLTDEYIKKVDALFKQKEKDLLTV